MKGYMQVTVLGNLVADPEERWAGLRDNERQKLAVFRLAVSQSKEEAAVFMDCEAWGKMGETVLQYTYKGAPLFVTGKLKCDRWEKNGKLNTRWKVVVQEARLLSARPAQQYDNYSNSSSGCRGAASVPPTGSAPGEIGYGHAAGCHGRMGQRGNETVPSVEDEDIPF